ncbi:MAG: hypothetical protein IT343_22800, partial [Candidatus Melainabacteria bacterium]|nr:hypothetical protein [Candidatus Melainabacteria bacterium]
MTGISKKLQSRVFVAGFIGWLCLAGILPLAANGQDALWSSMYDNAAKAFAEEDYQRAEKLTLETVGEAESLPKDGNQLVKSLDLLRKIYVAEKKTVEAGKVSERIESLGGVKTQSKAKLNDDSAAKGIKRNDAESAAVQESAENKQSTAAKEEAKPGPAATKAETRSEASTSSKPSNDDVGELNIEKELKGNTSVATTTAVSPVKTEAQSFKLKEAMKLTGH